MSIFGNIWKHFGNIWKHFGNILGDFLETFGTHFFGDK
jgi:hypothetical protein